MWATWAKFTHMLHYACRSLENNGSNNATAFDNKNGIAETKKTTPNLGDLVSKETLCCVGGEEIH